MTTPNRIPEAQGGPATPLHAGGDGVQKQVPPHRLPPSPAPAPQQVPAQAAQHPGIDTASEAASVDAGRSKLTITFTVDREGLSYFSDAYLAQLWHIGQANPAPFGDRVACDFAEAVGREIVRRWLAGTPPELWHHQGRHIRDAKALAAPTEGILYEHHDGRRKVASSPEAAQFTQGEPGWYRAGPVDVSELGRA